MASGLAEAAEFEEAFGGGQHVAFGVVGDGGKAEIWKVEIGEGILRLADFGWQKLQTGGPGGGGGGAQRGVPIL